MKNSPWDTGLSKSTIANANHCSQKECYFIDASLLKVSSDLFLCRRGPFFRAEGTGHRRKRIFPLLTVGKMSGPGGSEGDWVCYTSEASHNAGVGRFLCEAGRAVIIFFGSFGIFLTPSLPRDKHRLSLHQRPLHLTVRIPQGVTGLPFALPGYKLLWLWWEHSVELRRVLGEKVQMRPERTSSQKPPVPGRGLQSSSGGHSRAPE